MEAKEILHELMNQLSGIVKTETVVGKPFTVEGFTIIPVSRVRIGFGVGALNRGDSGKKGSLDSGGSGGGISVDPVALLVITKDGKISLYTMGEGIRGALAKAVDLVPELIEKLFKKKEGE